MARESFGQVMRVITKDGFVKPDSIQVLIDLVRENTKSLQAWSPKWPVSLRRSGGTWWLAMP